MLECKKTLYTNQIITILIMSSFACCFFFFSCFICNICHKCKTQITCQKQIDTKECQLHITKAKLNFAIRNERKKMKQKCRNRNDVADA